MRLIEARYYSRDVDDDVVLCFGCEEFAPIEHLFHNASTGEPYCPYCGRYDVLMRYECSE